MSAEYFMFLTSKIIDNNKLNFIKINMYRYLPLTISEQTDDLNMAICLELSKIQYIKERIKETKDWLKHHEPGYLRHLKYGGYFSEKSKKLIIHNKYRIEEDNRIISLREIKLQKIKRKLLKFLNYYTSSDSVYHIKSWFTSNKIKEELNNL